MKSLSQSVKYLFIKKLYVMRGLYFLPYPADFYKYWYIFYRIFVCSHGIWEVCIFCPIQRKATAKFALAVCTSHICANPVQSICNVSAKLPHCTVLHFSLTMCTLHIYANPVQKNCATAQFYCVHWNTHSVFRPELIKSYNKRHATVGRVENVLVKEEWIRTQPHCSLNSLGWFLGYHEYAN